MEKIVDYKKIYVGGVFLLIFGVYLFFTLQHVGQFETADEHYWIYSPDGGRVQQYWHAVLTGDWVGTLINDKPGVTVALVCGPALIFQQGHPQIQEYERDLAVETKNDPGVSQYIFTAFRVPQIIFNGLFSFLLMWLLWKLTRDKWVAYWGWFFILFCPALIGISQIVNPDSLLWSFSTATLLSFLLLLANKD